MKAFQIEWAKGAKICAVDVACQYDLPQVDCHACGSTWGQDFNYPAFRIKFLNRKEFNYDRVVTVAQFEKISERIQRAVGRRALLVPGSGIGELAGTAGTARLDDFTWGGTGCPQISKRARDVLAGEGIELLTADASILCRGRRLDSHLALQAEPTALLTEESLERYQIRHCPVCGDFDQHYPKPDVPEGYQIRRDLWPKGQHLVRVLETMRVLASEQFIEAVKKHNLTGIAFLEYGEYV